MMINEQTILEEDYDENYQPTEEEIYEYAQVIGLDPQNEPALLWIAREGINAPLPDNWKPCQDPNGDIYYFNFATGESIWDHPCDEYYRTMVSNERKKVAAGGGSGPKKKAPKKEAKKKEKAMKGAGQLGGSLGGGFGQPKGLGPLKSAAGPQTSVKNTGLSPVSGSLGPLKQDHLLGTGTSTLAGATMGGSSLASIGGPVRGSAPAALHTLGPLKGELKPQQQPKPTSAGLNKSLVSSTGENIQLLPSFSDEESEDPNKRFSFEIDQMDIGQLGYEDSDSDKRDPRIVIPNEGDSSGSDDYEKDVDFGIDKNLSERIMDIDMLEPAAATLDRDFENTLSVRSSGTFPGYDIKTGLTPRLHDELVMKPIVDERQQKAAMAASAAEKRFVYNNGPQLEEEEEKIKTANERALAEMRLRLEKELEDARLELLEDKDAKLKKIKGDIKKEQEEEARKLKEESSQEIKSIRSQQEQKTKDEEGKLDEQKAQTIKEIHEKFKKDLENEEGRIRQETDASMKKLKDEVESLQEEQKKSLEGQKDALLERLKKEVAEHGEKERKKLENENLEQLDKIRERLHGELQEESEQIEKRHAYRMEQARQELVEKHEKDMEKLKEQLQELQSAEKQKHETELKAVRERQKAVEDLEKGLEDVLQDRKREIKEDQQKEISRIRAEHEKNFRKTQEEYRDRERKDKQELEDSLHKVKQEMSAQHDREVDYIKDDYNKKRDQLKERYNVEELKVTERKITVDKETKEIDEEENKLQDRKHFVDHRKIELEKLVKEMERQERELEERRRMFRDELDRFEQEQQESLSKRTVSLHSKEMERMQIERENLQKDLRDERKSLDNIRREKSTFETDLAKLKRSRDSYAKKVRILRESVDTDKKDSERKQAVEESALDETLTQEPPSEAPETLNIDDLTSSAPKPAPRRRVQSRSPEDESNKENVSELNTDQIGEELLQRPISKKATIHDFSDDDSMTDDILLNRHHRFPSKFSNVKEHLARENDSIGQAKEFLKKQRHSLKRRQAALRAAKMELKRDLMQQEDVSSIGANMLHDVEANLEKEAEELDNIFQNMSQGTRLLKEKEHKVRQLQMALESDESASDTESFFKPFLSGSRARKPSRGLEALDLDHSDSDESSGVGSNDMYIEDLNIPQAFNVGMKNKFQSMPSLHVGMHNALDNRVENQLGNQVGPEVIGSIKKINDDLGRVMSMLNLPQSAGAPAQAEDRPAAPVSREPPTYPLHSWQPVNPYISKPVTKVDWGNAAFESAEAALERKWRKYFGDRRPPLSSFSLSRPNIAFGPVSGREAVSNFKGPLTSLQPNSIPSEDRLAQHRDWLNRFQRDIGLSPYHGSASDCASVNSIPASVDLAQPTGSQKLNKGGVRLELDENNALRVRQY
ncbi:centrosomal protein of 164 kDa-like isoform X2 [Lineus longissimus]|uniref:centrosomal protein of 164 kDa-like isoform X2 n=1 Tax=Lineus longissimus TaxID=88925 RepID=UPI00315DA0B4